MYRRRSGVEVRRRKPWPRAPDGSSEATRLIVARPHPGSDLAGPDHARLVVDAVAAEQLVGALAGQHHLDVLACLAGGEPQRDGGRVRHRVVQVPDDPGQAGEELLRADHVGDGLHAERRRRGHGVVDFVIALVLESDGEGQQAGRGLGRERAEGGRVHPAGQERADRYVAAQVNGHRVAHRGQDLVRRARRRRPGRLELGPPVPEHVDPAARPGDQHVPGRQRPRGRHQGGGRGHVLERQVPAQRVRVDRGHLAGIGQRLAFGGEPELRPGPGLLTTRGQRVEERLDAERVARAEQLPGAPVPDRERVHAPELADDIAAEPGVHLDQHLGGRPAAQPDTAGEQPLGQLDVVVDLAVEDHHEPAVRRLNRLAARHRGVDDGQPPEAQGQVVIGEETLVVGPPVGDAHGGTAHPLGVGPCSVCQRQAAGNSAHACRPYDRGT